MIIDISKPETHTEECFFAVSDGFHKNERHGDGFVQMCVTPVFDDTEDQYVIIDFSDNIMEKEGDYLPLDFNKNELAKLIEFLKAQYDRFNR